ncbi:hypothetical protein BKA57DRAFT_471823 [Linnemannia elongata]|nr:hypothetical protein BKA57DRAFT_471823 [Linnemannia elongata]
MSELEKRAFSTGIRLLFVSANACYFSVVTCALVIFVHRWLRGNLKGKGECLFFVALCLYFLFFVVSLFDHVVRFWRRKAGNDREGRRQRRERERE